jgi:hypothetical protein
MDFLHERSTNKKQTWRLGFQPRTCGNLIDRSSLFYHYARSTREIDTRDSPLSKTLSTLIFLQKLAKIWQNTRKWCGEVADISATSSWIPFNAKNNNCVLLLCATSWLGYWPNLFKNLWVKLTSTLQILCQLQRLEFKYWIWFHFLTNLSIHHKKVRPEKLTMLREHAKEGITIALGSSINNFPGMVPNVGPLLNSLTGVWP